MINLQLYLTIV